VFLGVQQKADFIEVIGSENELVIVEIISEDLP
jgi:hypothetical protein